MQETDVIIIGAGAAGLMCAIEAGKRGRRVIVLEKSNKPGRKILMSGGGRCNFTNEDIGPQHYISNTPHFFKSALARYTQWDFIARVQQAGIPFHEKTKGQLFCDRSAKDIVEMLLADCRQYGIQIILNSMIEQVDVMVDQKGFLVKTQDSFFSAPSLVVATGGLSIPSMGSSDFAYVLARQFGLNVRPISAGLVPFVFNIEQQSRFSILSGMSVLAEVSNERIAFCNDILLTHRGLSGPAILQISSYWQPGETILIRMLPTIDLWSELKKAHQKDAKKRVKTVLGEYFPKRLVEVFLGSERSEKILADCSHLFLQEIADQFQAWRVKPHSTEGYKTAEVTLGGVDCATLSSKTMEVHSVKGLYFIGEALDVTGWLGGYNFQWAWSSGWAAGQVC